MTAHRLLSRQPPLAQQAIWALAQGGALALAGWLTPAWLPLGAALGAALALALLSPPSPSHWPLVGLTLLAAAWASAALGLSPAPGVAAVAGLWAGRGMRGRLEAMLAGIAGAGVASGVAGALLAGAAPWVAAWGGGLIVGAGGAQALVPGWIRAGAQVRPPWSEVVAALDAAYRPPVHAAYRLYGELRSAVADPAARSGIEEVAGWVYRLALSLQALDRDAQRVDVLDVAARVQAIDDTPSEDPVVRARQQATRAHLTQTLAHREALLRERARAAALQDYALAWLEEARAGVAVALSHPGEAAPERLDEVLKHLRDHTAEGEARRRAARELQGL